MHHVWQHRLPTCTLQDYQHVVETLKLTPRMWNSNLSLNRVLRHVSFQLGLDVNIIGVKRWRNNADTLGTCVHNNSWCVFPYFRFQNTLTKLLFPVSTNFSQINLVFYKKRYYVLSSISYLRPFLINQLPTKTIAYNNIEIMPKDITNIIKNCPVSYPFTIAIYTSFAYVQSIWIKQIKKNLIGYSICKDNSDIVYLFITPHLNSLYSVSVLETITDDITQFNRKNIFSNPHITEGQFNNRQKSPVNQDLLNQEHCLCDHPETQQFLSPEERVFKPLGTILKRNLTSNIIANNYLHCFSAPATSQKYFLYENLGTNFIKVNLILCHIFTFLFLECLGLLSEETKTCLKICSELSLIR